MKGISDEELRKVVLPQTPGGVFDFRQNLHDIMITATTEEGCHTGRRRYRVECTTCNVVLHEMTTGPFSWHQQHVLERPLGLREGLDWNDTGAWAVVSLTPGIQRAKWALSPSLGLSRWESEDAARQCAAAWREHGPGFVATVISWGADLDDFRTLPRNTRVSAALAATQPGAWAVVSVAPGMEYPTIGVSRWEREDDARQHVMQWRAQGHQFAAAVLKWGDDLLDGYLLGNARVITALGFTKPGEER